MSSIILVIAGLFVFFIGYKFYSNFLGQKIYEIDDSSLSMPSSSFEDGVDYIPTKKHILFGHHFTSIAGAAPIVGPCVAAYWGWLPALLWILFGTVFMGAVHDFGALVTSVKEKGRSIADIASLTISDRARSMFLVFVICFHMYFYLQVTLNLYHNLNYLLRCNQIKFPPIEQLALHLFAHSRQ